MRHNEERYEIIIYDSIVKNFSSIAVSYLDKFQQNFENWKLAAELKTKKKKIKI